ncbi:hypothetical protein SLS64_001414 [Diaporthe eres]
MGFNSGGPFPILQLPRELRDEVWRYAVVRPKIFVSFGRLEDLQQRALCPDRPLRTCMSWENKDAYHEEDLYQSGTYFRPRKFEDFWNKDSNEGNGESQYEVDYDKLALGYPALDVRDDENKHLDLSIFLTCRQISTEAMDTYYAENKFVFCLINFGASDCSMTSANAAWSFLRDRPRAMLPRIRQFDLHLYGWDECDGFQILDPQVWKNLMGIIKSHMKLQHLGLYFRGRLTDLRDGDANAESNLLYNGQILGFKNIRAQLIREPEPVANDTERQDLNTRHDSKCNYFLSMQTYDDYAGYCLLPRQYRNPANDENARDQMKDCLIDIFEPLGGSASLDHVKTRGRRYD